MTEFLIHASDLVPYVLLCGVGHLLSRVVNRAPTWGQEVLAFRRDLWAYRDEADARQSGSADTAEPSEALPSVAWMGRVYTALGFVLALGIIGLLGWALVRGVIDEPGVVGSFATAAAAIVAVVYGRAREQMLELQASHREKMAPIYRQLIQRFVKFEESGEAELTEFAQEFMFDLSVYGPTPVVETWVEWTRQVAELEAADPRLLFLWEQVFAVIRKDLGHDAGDLRQGDLLRVFVTDVDKHLPADRADRPKLG